MSKKFILGQKLGMSQVYTEGGILTPVTVVSVTPNVVTQVRKAENGKTGAQIATGTRKKIAKPLKGHLKDLGNFRWLREFRIDGEEMKRGDVIDVNVFTEGDVVNVTATSKGKGFQGVVKRHGFRGGPASHGHPHNHRAPGSIGCRFPQHVHKGKRMAGHMGAETVTIRHLTVVKVDMENKLLALKGAIPGHRGTLVKVVSEK